MSCNKEFNILTLPCELLLRICSFLDFKGLQRFFSICKGMQEFRRKLKIHEIRDLYAPHSQVCYSEQGTKRIDSTCFVSHLKIFQALPNGILHGYSKVIRHCGKCDSRYPLQEEVFVYGLKHGEFIDFTTTLSFDCLDGVGPCKQRKIRIRTFEMDILKTSQLLF